MLRAVWAGSIKDFPKCTKVRYALYFPQKAALRQTFVRAAVIHNQAQTFSAAFQQHANLTLTLLAGKQQQARAAFFPAIRPWPNATARDWPSAEPTLPANRRSVQHRPYSAANHATLVPNIYPNRCRIKPTRHRNGLLPTRQMLGQNVLRRLPCRCGHFQTAILHRCANAIVRQPNNGPGFPQLTFPLQKPAYFCRSTHHQSRPPPHMAYRFAIPRQNDCISFSRIASLIAGEALGDTLPVCRPTIGSQGSFIPCRPIRRIGRRSFRPNKLLRQNGRRRGQIFGGNPQRQILPD